jgi:hypothetical protein
MDKGAPGLWKPALIGGAVFGFLGGAPLIELLNCACCALVVGAGFVAGLLYSRQCAADGFPFDPASGAKVGFLAGIIYGIVETITGTISRLLFHDAGVLWVVDFLEEMPQVPPEVTELLTQGMERSFVSATLWTLLMALAFGIIFATLGGLIAGAAFRSRPAAPPGPAA